MDFGFLGHQPGQYATQAQRFGAQLGAEPVDSRSSRVAFVEDQVDNFQNRLEAGGELIAGRHFERHLSPGDRLLRPYDALRNSRLRDQVRPADLCGGQAPKKTQGQRRPGLHGKQRMARHEDQTKPVIRDLIAGGVAEVGSVGSQQELRVLARQDVVPAEQVDGLSLADGHEPGAGIAGGAFNGPLLDGVD